MTSQSGGLQARSSSAFAFIANMKIRAKIFLAFGALVVPLAVLTRSQTNGRRALWMLALALFAVSANHLGHFHDEAGGWMAELVGHHAVLPLEAAEFGVLFDLIITRMAMTIVISSWRAARYPANRNYILRNNAAAWARLQRMAALSRDQAKLQIQRACHVR